MPWMNQLSQIKNNIFVGFNEYEFILPRGCLFEIIQNKIPTIYKTLFLFYRCIY